MILSSMMLPEREKKSLRLESKWKYVTMVVKRMKCSKKKHEKTMMRKDWKVTR